MTPDDHVDSRFEVLFDMTGNMFLRAVACEHATRTNPHMAVPTVVMSACAAECFVNVVIDDARFLYNTHPCKDQARLRWFGELWAATEDEGKIRTKYKAAYKVCTPPASALASDSWQRFCNLITLRNAYVHHTPLIMSGPVQPRSSMAHSDALLTRLSQYGIVKHRSSSIGPGESLVVRWPEQHKPTGELISAAATVSSWHSALDNFETAEWAVNTSLDMVLFMCNALSTLTDPPCRAVGIGHSLTNLRSRHVKP